MKKNLEFYQSESCGQIVKYGDDVYLITWAMDDTDEMLLYKWAGVPKEKMEDYPFLRGEEESWEYIDDFAVKLTQDSEYDWQDYEVQLLKTLQANFGA